LLQSRLYDKIPDAGKVGLGHDSSKPGLNCSPLTYARKSRDQLPLHLLIGDGVAHVSEVGGEPGEVFGPSNAIATKWEGSVLPCILSPLNCFLGDCLVAFLQRGPDLCCSGEVPGIVFRVALQTAD